MYLPEIFKTFLERHSDISDAFRTVGDLAAAAGPLESKAQHLIQLGVSIGQNSRGGVRSHARRAIEAGSTPEEVLQAVLLSSTIVGFPAMIAAYGWVNDVLNTQSS